ncbi:hypothetical protein BTJ39_19040 [Izhakiella australiensis]|uniref:Uncharacterized protein n=1 Tax=Izhakiella australiensis TaxID=1926881 RepID=A0A1S8YGW8_9GAMM|nr:hypothetical protein [Izhakiella australiensis]OON38068.1 hypothetical protein BTJ39_19040 [Izhakiella australiensis]
MSSEKLAAHIIAHEILLKSVLNAVPKAYLQLIASEAGTQFSLYQRGAASRDDEAQNRVQEARQIVSRLLGKQID